MTLIVSVLTGHGCVPSLMVNVGQTVSTTMVHVVISVMVFQALSLAHDTLKFNVPFVLHETSIVPSQIVGVATLYQFV